MTTILDGQKVSKEIKEELKEKIAIIKKKYDRLPKLVVILIGNNSASLSYVTSKEKQCLEIGFDSEVIKLDENVSEEEVLHLINNLNLDSSVDGILVQLPIPKHINEYKLISAIDPNKDVDGFHPINIGNLVIGQECFVPCTPKGIMYLLEKYQISLSGKNVVVLGRSNIVGKPIAQLCLNKNATVTICHSKTNELKKVCKTADILIVAIGKSKFIDHEYIKENAVVIDVGINRIEGKICGDVNYEDVFEHCSYITPVPKGIGPMTIAMLLQNTIESFERRMKNVKR